MRVLSPDEEARYLAAAARECIDLADVATVMLRQGPRPDEVMSLEQSQVDLRNRHFTIWDSSAQGKSRNAHRKLKMTDETFHIFQRRLSVPGIWVFLSSKNDGRALRSRKHITGPFREGSPGTARRKAAAALNADCTICGIVPTF